MRRSRIALVLPFAFIGVVVPSSVASAAAPANDLFADATPIVLDFAEVVDTTEATAGEAEDLAAQAACNSPEPAATVWYTLTVDSVQWVILSSEPPTYSSGFNVVVDTGDGFECVAGGPVRTWFIGEPGVTYIIQSLDDQLDGGGNGGTLNFSATSGGAPEPEICPGLIPNDPFFPPGLNRVFGTEGPDHLRGTPGDDLIIGLGGDDVMRGLGGNDIIIGCDGDDTIRGGPGDDFIVGDSADFFGDPGSTSGGDDDIRGGPGNDEIRGGPGNDDIHGNAGDDGLFGNQGDDDMSGDGGDDFMGGGFGNDIVRGGGGSDFVSGGFGDDDLSGGGGDDFLTGDLPNGEEDPFPNEDTCNGNGGFDVLQFCEEAFHGEA